MRRPSLPLAGEPADVPQMALATASAAGWRVAAGLLVAGSAAVAASGRSGAGVIDG